MATSMGSCAKVQSNEVAYPHIPFPNTTEGSRCVLCQNDLDQQAQVRLRSFEEFVRSDLQVQAETAVRQLQDLETSLLIPPTSESLLARIDSIGYINEQLGQALIEFSNILTARRQSVLTATSFEEILSLPRNEIIQLLDALSAELETLALASDEDARGQNRDQLEINRRNLSSRKWLSQQRSAIDAEILHLREISRLRVAEDLTNTAALSRRKSAIAEELITAAYVQRFKDELKTLGAERLLVDLKKTRAEVGRVYHRITLRSSTAQVPTSEILSEGELRIVSLAAFLADTEGRGSQTTFIFDDPISSLDHIYEEATAKRLVALSRSRQVLVFTHRLSLVGLLQKYSDKLNIPTNLVCLSRLKIGEIAELPINLTKTKPTVNRLISENLAAAKRAYQTDEVAYEAQATYICRSIRILIEQVVESDLLNGIVRRYSAEVQTKNKIEFLAKITPEDCSFIDDIMTAYSRYEHSQSEEAPVELPNPDRLEEDLRNILALIESLQSRRT